MNNNFSESDQVVIAGANEMLNILQYRGLSMDQCLQAILTLTTSFVEAIAQVEAPLVKEAFIKENVDNYCRLLRLYTGTEAYEKRMKKPARLGKSLKKDAK